MKRRTMQSSYFSMITPAVGTRELKWGSSSSSTGTGSMSKQQGGGGGPVPDPCVPILGICFP